MKDEYRIATQEALEIIFQYSQIQGSHHKSWCIDQITRKLCINEENYKRFVDDYKNGASNEEDEDNDNTYSWDEGIAP